MANYYISNGGLNSNPGTISQPFATPEHAQTIAVAGDSLFMQANSEFESLTLQKAGTSANPFHWGKYGSGANPKVHGWKTMTGWSSIGNGLFRITDPGLPPRVRIIMVDNVQKTVARLPRENYYQILSGTGAGSGTITDASNLSGKNFTGAEMFTKKELWVVDTGRVTAHSGSTINYIGTSSNYNLRNSWGYGIQNHRDCCTQLFDWCQEGSDIIMFFGAVSPSFHQIKCSFRAGFDINTRGFNRFSNIDFEGFNGNVGSNTINFSSDFPVFRIHNSQQLYFQNCGFRNMGAPVFHTTASNCNDLEIADCTVEDCLQIFVWIRFTGSPNTTRFKVLRTNFQRIGTILGQGGNGDNGYSCIVFSGGADGVRILGNDLRNIGYNGIEWAGFDILVSRNRIEHGGLVKGDGGCVYSYGKSDENKAYLQSNRIVSHNICLNSPGNRWGVPSQFANGFPEPYGDFEGIYIDDHVRNCQIIHNTISGCKIGIKAANNNGLLIRHNKMYNNLFGALLTNSSNGTFDMRNLDFQFNQIYQGNANTVIWIESLAHDFDLWGVIDNNYYMRPSNQNAIIRHWKIGAGGYDNLINLAEWRNRTIHDDNTKVSPISSNLSFLYTNETAQDSVSQSILRRRVNVDGNEVTELFLNAFESAILLGDLGPLIVAPIPEPDPGQLSYRGRKFVISN